MSGEMKQVGNWRGQINTLLSDALTASVEILGKNGENATRHAIILMAQSARKMTPQAKKNRKIQRDEDRRPYLAKHQKSGITRWYLPNRKQYPERYAEMLTRLRPIAGRGLAKRSWMWGLRGLKGARTAGSRKPMTAVAYLQKILGPKASGYVLTNSLTYLLRIMPPGWQESVARKAGNRIMAQAKRKIERQWKRELEGKRIATAKVPAGLEKYFLRA